MLRYWPAVSADGNLLFLSVKMICTIKYSSLSNSQDIRASGKKEVISIQLIPVVMTGVVRNVSLAVR